MKHCHSRSMLMIDNLWITDKPVDDKDEDFLTEVWTNEESDVLSFSSW